ncbi:MAG: RND transporter [Candidatus Electrothrix sp. AR4]|nr:RND transporter [Candidatus Electrothrix sp. AR4]
MRKIAQWLDAVPLPLVLLVALFLGLAPFVPEPHLFEKMKMLMNGTLHRSIDIFDFAYHGLPVILLLVKLIRIVAEISADK